MHVKKREKHPKIKKLGYSYFFSSLGFAFIGTIWAVYLNSFLKNDSLVGFLSAFLVIISAISYIYFTPLIEKSRKSRLFFLILSLYIISYILFAIIPNIYAIIILAILTSVLASIRMTTFGIIVRDKSDDKEVSKNEGLIYTTLNIAWFIGPIIAGYIASRLGLKSVFLFGAGLIFISLLIFKLTKISDTRITKKIDKNPFKIFIEFFKKKDRTFAYLIGGGIDLWWSFIYIYMPLYIINNGLGNITLGYFLAAITVPPIILEYSISKLAGKKGFKKIFFTGYLILAIAAFICFFVADIYLILIILILASIGAAMLEPTTEAYFFDIIKKDERDKFYGTFNTTMDTQSFIGKVLGAIALLFLPFKFLFILFSVLMLVYVIISLKIRNVIEERRKSRR